MAKILYAEDDDDLAEQVTRVLKKQGHSVEWTADGADAKYRLSAYSYDLIILDWKLPGATGIDVCKNYRLRGGKQPVLILTALQEVGQKIDGLDAGADDYLTKPFSSDELLARTRALLRRQPILSGAFLQIGNLSLDLNLREARRGSRELGLWPKEVSVLEFFMRHPNVVFNTAQLLDKLWTIDESASEAAVRQCLHRLRSKVDQNNEKPLFVTIKGLGYKIVSSEDATQ